MAAAMLVVGGCGYSGAWDGVFVVGSGAWLLGGMHSVARGGMAEM